jgi:hypothetical protein
MDKSFIVFLAVGIGFFYVITNFVGDIEKDDGYPTTSMEEEAHKYDKYMSVDSIGRDIIVVDALDRDTQIKVWNRSEVRDEFLDFFPEFDEMRKIIKERVSAEDFREYLIDKVDSVETSFLNGDITSDDALKKLQNLR